MYHNRIFCSNHASLRSPFTTAHVQYCLFVKEKEREAGINSSEESEEKKKQKEMREEAGLISLLINALTVGKQDEFTLSELKDTVLAYARGDVPELVTVLSKDDMEKFNKASKLEKVQYVSIVMI